jgi:heat shock protein HtpX
LNYVKTAVLLAMLTALFVFIGNLLGGRQGAVIALVIAGAMNFFSYWFSDKIVLKIYKARAVDEASAPELYSVVRELTVRAGLPMPKVYIMENETPNAFATGRNPSHAAVAVTSGIQKILTRDELRGVIGHELAHISNRDILISTLAATIAGAISYLAHMAYFASLFGGRDNDRGGNPFVLIAMMIVAPMAAMVIQMAISRSREYAADRLGAEYAGSAHALAGALRKLENFNKAAPMRVVSEDISKATAHLFIVSPIFGGGGGSMRKFFSTHPPMEERIRRLEAMVLNG